MAKVAVIGAGVSGLTCARQLVAAGFTVKVFEREDKVGGLIRCNREQGSLFHICGGHVFNTKNKQVNDWFWKIFDKEHDFVQARRRAAVCMEDGRFIDYPIENHVYQLDAKIQESFYNEVRAMIGCRQQAPSNFEEFLVSRFGPTLYKLYFGPYNRKVWRSDLRDIPLSWLEGKLPMPTPEEMLEANEQHIEEATFVHSSFYYAKNGGSQFIADTLAKGIDVNCGAEVIGLEYTEDKVAIYFAGGGVEVFEYCVFCGNIKALPNILKGVDLGDLTVKIDNLKSHGTTAVFCETDAIPYSWFYQPSDKHQSHRFICTGNFAPSNNALGKMTCTVEFTDEMGADDVKEQLKLMPFNPKYLTHHYSKYTYPVQSADTRDVVQAVRAKLDKYHIKLVGRFAEWEYYNMDAAMASAMKCLRGVV